MKIHFKSKYTVNDESNIIEFEAPVEKWEENEWTFLKFEEKREGYKKNIQNLIEFTKDKIAIHSGPSTLELELNQKIKNSYKVDVENIKELFIWTWLKELNIHENKIEFKYCVGADESFEGCNFFELELEWK